MAGSFPQVLAEPPSALFSLTHTHLGPLSSEPTLPLVQLHPGRPREEGVGAVKPSDSGASQPGSNPSSSTSQLCGFGQVTSPLCALISLAI